MNVLEAVTDTLDSTKEVLIDGVCNIKDAIVDFFDEDAGITRKMLTLIVIIAALAGLIYGLIIAPKKKVIVETCSCNDDWDDEDWD
ncbi:MAG: hypothetical protein IJP29_04285 [Lachnospiraceae bacterium]|nr:hypothetical protein [Lachnospiraceae bacterium]